MHDPMASNSEKIPVFRQKSKLARHLQPLLTSRPDDPASKNQGVSTMSIAKFQSAAIALVGAVIVASLFVSAAVPVVIA